MPCAHGSCASDPRTEEELRSVENRWLQALQTKDRDALECILAATFIDSSMQGELRTRADVFAGLGQPRNYQQKLIFDRIVVHGDTGVVAGRNLISDQSSHPLFQIRFTDTFVYENGSWRALAAQEVRVPN